MRVMIFAAAVAVAVPAVAAPQSPGAAGCAPEALSRSFNDGYIRGVDDIRAQLAKATADTQAVVQRQLNEQLAVLQKQRDAEMEAQIRAANQKSLGEAIRVPMPQGMTGVLPAPAPVPPGVTGLPDDPSDLAPGSTLIIRNAERLPPALYAELLVYLKQ